MCLVSEPPKFTHSMLRNMFSEDDVYIPSKQEPWVYLKDCVWKGPSWFTFKHCLASILSYDRLYELFKNVMKLDDVGVTHLIDDLIHIQINPLELNNEEEREIFHVYEELSAYNAQSKLTAKEIQHIK
jgi:hypothetical protein